MLIVVNGIPKSGTHALLKAVYLNRPKVGVWGTEHGHFPAPEIDSESCNHLLIFRNPRDVVVSMARNVAGDAKIDVAAVILRFSAEKTFQQYAMGYVPYMSDGRTHVIRYEGMMSDPSVIRGICARVGYEYVDKTFEVLPTAWTATLNRHKTKWRDYWTDEIDAVWQENGLEFERLLGYDNG